MKHKNPTKRFATKALMGALASLSASSVLASGSSLPLSNVVDLEMGRAGGSAIAQDASTSFTNPAGLVRIHNKQLVSSAVIIIAHKNFSGTMTNPGLGSTITERGSASTSPHGTIPAIHYAMPLSSKLAFGFSVTEPYGLGIDYSNHSIVRYSVINSKNLAIDMSPSFGYRITPKLSVGLGLDVLYYGLNQRLAVRLQPLTTQDAIQVNEADGWGKSWHAGVLYEFTPQTRVGLTHHAQYIVRVAGSSRFFTQGGAVLSTGVNGKKARATLPLASVTVLSAYHDVTPRWAVMGTIEREGWGIAQFDRAYNISTPTASTDSITAKRLHDTWFFGLGTGYQLSDKWIVRTGISYSESAADVRYRGIYVTNPSAVSIGMGAHYQVSRELGLDASYGHSYYNQVQIRHTNSANNTLIGVSTEAADSVGFQVEWDIV